MRRFFRYSLFCFYLALSGCQLTGPDDSETGSQINILQPEDIWPMKDSFEVVSAKVEGDILHIKVAYSGGCAEHDFSFYSKGPAIETAPLTADLIVYHDANDDACDAWITEFLWVDVNPIRSSRDSEIRIHIVDGEHNGDTTVSYRY